MDSLNLYSNDEIEEQKIINRSPNSIQPSPTPHFFDMQMQLHPSMASPIASEMENHLPQSGKGGRRSRKVQEQAKNMNRGHWSTEENKKYHWFLEIHYMHFVNRHMRRMDKIFKTMELFVGTRQAEQCRSHHQKMQKKYLNFITIIINLRKQHYNSLDLEPILQDMGEAQIVPDQALATIQQLRQQENATPQSPQVRQRKKSVVPKIQKEAILMNKEQYQVKGQQQKLDEQNFHKNMLDESNLNIIGDLSLFHDESCMFNSMFKNQP